jgi:hypothetical protein
LLSLAVLHMCRRFGSALAGPLSCQPVLNWLGYDKLCAAPQLNQVVLNKACIAT